MSCPSRIAITVCLAVLSVTALTGCKRETPVEAAVEQPALTDLDRMQGTWQGTETGGSEAWTMVIDGDQLSVDGPGPQDYAGTLRLNETATPKSAIIVITTCAFEEYVGAAANGIYRFDGEALILAATEPGSGTHPDGFDPTGDIKVFTFEKMQAQASAE